jgi:hypothetical protein
MNIDIILIIITLSLLVILGIQQYRKMHKTIPNQYVNPNKSILKKGCKKVNKMKKKVHFRD